jgi:serine acetyltransferase
MAKMLWRLSNKAGASSPPLRFRHATIFAKFNNIVRLVLQQHRILTQIGIGIAIAIGRGQSKVFSIGLCRL